MPLTGTYTRNLDDKNRVAIPKRLSEEFGAGKLDSLYISPGLDKSLSLYSPAGFDDFAKRFSEQSLHKLDVRTYVRLLYSQTEKVDLDAQGRIRIPDRLVQLAGLTRDVVLMGVHDHAELWDAKAWEAYIGQHGPAFDDVAARALGG
jgi:MraZ protein